MGIVKSELAKGLTLERKMMTKMWYLNYCEYIASKRNLCGTAKSEGIQN